MKPKISIVYKREIYLMILIYIFILLPLVLGLVYLAVKLDRFYEFPKVLLVNNFVNIFSSLTLISAGTLIIWWAYTYLVVLGEGSPAQMLGQTKKLVTRGPYSLVRHPSIIGKFLIVLGVGIMFNSFSFILIIIPLLFCYAYFERIREEKRLLKLWHNEYLEYKNRVPRLLPKIKSLFALFTDSK